MGVHASIFPLSEAASDLNRNSQHQVKRRGLFRDQQPDHQMKDLNLACPDLERERAVGNGSIAYGS
jgi:hypothetical protein